MRSFGCAFFIAKIYDRKDVVNLKVIICERCGANSLHEENNYYVCDYCGTKFIKKPEGEGISLNSDIERLLQKCKTDPKNAKKYANLILDIDPDNTEVYKYL